MGGTSDHEFRAAYQLIWDRLLPEPEVVEKPSIQESWKNGLAERWRAEKQAFIDSLAQMRRPVAGILAAPHLDGLESYLMLSQYVLEERESFDEALGFIEAIDESLARVMAYRVLRIALELAGSRAFLRELSDAEVTFMKDNPDWCQILAEIEHANRPTGIVEDQIPGGLPRQSD